jgi:hypothetical protein
MYSGDNYAKKVSLPVPMIDIILMIQHIDPHAEKNWPTIDIYGPKHMLKTKTKVSQKTSFIFLLFVKKQKNK